MYPIMYSVITFKAGAFSAKKNSLLLGHKIHNKIDNGQYQTISVHSITSKIRGSTNYAEGFTFTH